MGQSQSTNHGEAAENLLEGDSKNLKNRQLANGGIRPTYHNPVPMKAEDIFDLYTKVIEEDFAHNQGQYNQVIGNERSAFAKIQKNFIEIERGARQPIGFVPFEAKIPVSFVDRDKTSSQIDNGSFQDNDQSMKKTASSKLQYTLIGMCFVNEKCIDHTQQLKEEILKKIKHYPTGNNSDTAWANMFVIYITLQSNDLDLRIQKCLLKEMQTMLDGGAGNLQALDSNRYRSLYIAKVYEHAPAVVGAPRVAASENPNQGQIGEQIIQQDKITVDVSDINLINLQLTPFDEKLMQKGSYDLNIDTIGISEVAAKGFMAKFSTIQSHLHNKKDSRDDQISQSGHPVMRLMKRFQRNLQSILVTKIENEINALKTAHQENQNQQQRSSLEQEIIVEGNGEIGIAQIIDQNAQEIFKWLLERSITQIKVFGQIIQVIIVSFYGDMRQIPDQQMCLSNLMISEIFRIKRPPTTRAQKPSNENDASPNDKFQRLLKYPGIFDENANNLYQSIRNLYSLSMRQEILQIIAKIANYSIYKEHSKNHEPEDDKEHVLSDYQKRAFEKAINCISNNVSSPIAKVIAYKQQITQMIERYDDMEADQVQDTILNAILDFKDFDSIENLFIELQFIQAFVPPEQQYRELFQPCNYMIASITLIMQNGVEGVAGDFQGQDAESGSSDNNEDEYESENDEKVVPEHAADQEESDENNILRGAAQNPTVKVQVEMLNNLDDDNIEQ